MNQKLSKEESSRLDRLIKTFEKEVRYGLHPRKSDIDPRALDVERFAPQLSEDWHLEQEAALWGSDEKLEGFFEFDSSPEHYSEGLESLQLVDESFQIEETKTVLPYNESEDVYEDLEGRFDDLIYNRLTMMTEFRDEFVDGFVVETGEYAFPMCEKEVWMFDKIVNKPALFIEPTRKLLTRMHEVSLGMNDNEFKFGLKLVQEIYGVSHKDATYIRRILVKLFGTGLTDYVAQEESCKIILGEEIVKTVKNEASLMKLKEMLIKDYKESNYSETVLMQYVRKMFLMTHLNYMATHNTVIDAVNESRFLVSKEPRLTETRLELALRLDGWLKNLDSRMSTEERKELEVSEAFNIPEFTIEGV